MAEKTKNSSKTKHLDTRWFSKLKDTGWINNKYDGNKLYRNRQKADFLSGIIRNPKLDYPLLEKVKIEEKKEKIIKLRTDILTNEENEIVRKAYVWKLDEILVQIEMLLSSWNLQRARKRQLIKKYSFDFQILTEELYGRPDDLIFGYVVGKMHEYARQYLRSNKQQIKKAALSFEKVLPRYFSSNDIFPEIKEIKKKIKKSIQAKMDTINIPRENRKYEAKEIKNILEDVAKIFGSSWKVRLNTNIANTYVDTGKKIIYVPAGRTMTLRGLNKMIAHEILSHVARSENGSKSRLKLLSVGLDNYLPSEEGIATLRERYAWESGWLEKLKMLFKKEVSTIRLLGYFSIGLVYGLDGKKRDFRDLYKIMEKYCILFQAVKAAENKEVFDIKKAKSMAWDRCVRTFRGTNCDIPGVCFTKDLVYLTGRLKLIKAISANIQEIDRFDCGKYDPANPRHIWILDKLGIK